MLVALLHPQLALAQNNESAILGALIRDRQAGLQSGSQVGAQTLSVAPNSTVTAQISQKEISRIAIEGGKIRATDARNGAIEILTDTKVPGELRVLPPENDKRPINLFVTSEKGHTYTLILTVADLPSQTILLRETAKPSAVERDNNVAMGGGNHSSNGGDPFGSRGASRSPELERTVRALTIAMARDERPSGVEIIARNRTMQLWQESRFTLSTSWVARGVVGDLYTLTNVSNQLMRLAEPEFFKAGVLAVSFDAAELPPGTQTNVYIIRERSRDE